MGACYRATLAVSLLTPHPFHVPDAGSTSRAPEAPGMFSTESVRTQSGSTRSEGEMRTLPLGSNLTSVAMARRGCWGSPGLGERSGWVLDWRPGFGAIVSSKDFRQTRAEEQTCSNISRQQSPWYPFATPQQASPAPTMLQSWEPNRPVVPFHRIIPVQ